MSSHEERMKKIEDNTQFLNDFVDHYLNHLGKVVLRDFSNCQFCRKLVEDGKVIKDEGIATKGISRTAQSLGNEIYVLVPKSWLGKEVRVSLVK